MIGRWQTNNAPGRRVRVVNQGVEDQITSHHPVCELVIRLHSMQDATAPSQMKLLVDRRHEDDATAAHAARRRCNAVVNILHRCASQQLRAVPHRRDECAAARLRAVRATTTPDTRVVKINIYVDRRHLPNGARVA